VEIQQSIKRTAIYHRDYHMNGIDDFVNVKVSNVRHRVVKLFVILCLTALALHLGYQVSQVSK